MSNKIVKNGVPIHKPLFGNGGEIKTINIVNMIPKSAKEATERIQDIPLNKIRSFGNRDTEVKNLRKIVNKAGGINGNLWQTPRVAKLPNSDEYILWDGDHSRALYTNLYSDREFMPCRVVEVSSMKEVHDLFVQANAKCRTAINAEVIYVNKVLSNDTTALKIKDKLIASGLYIYCSSELSGKQGDLNGYKVKIGGAERCFEKAGDTTQKVKSFVKPAADLISSMAFFQHKDFMPAELLEALTMVFVSYPKMLPAGAEGLAFRQWFLDVSKRRTVKAFATDLKRQGGNKVNAAAYSIARGMISEMRKDAILFGSITSRQLTKKFG